MTIQIERIGGLIRHFGPAPAGATTRIQFDSTTGAPATVFVRNNATNKAITVAATPDDADATSPLVCPLGIGNAGSIPAGSTASVVLPSPLRAILITVPADADAGADIVVLE
jgi:hypothetical protein